MRLTFDLPVSHEADVIVCGGGPAGVAAALSAARNGARALLIERMGFCGGSATAMQVPALAPFSDRTKAIHRGIGWEVLTEHARRLGRPVPDPDFYAVPQDSARMDWSPIDVETLKRIYDDLLEAAGVTVLYHTFVPALTPRPPLSEQPAAQAREGENSPHLALRNEGNSERGAGGESKYAALDARQRETELQRLLTRANIERMRALIVAAGKTLDEAESLAATVGPKSIAQVQEQRGDLLAMEERWESARDCFDSARKNDPTRALAEKKYAEMTVKLADEEAFKRLGGAILQGDSIPELLSGPRAGKKNPAVAMLASAMVPGLGQVLSGQFTRGAICMGVWIVCLGWIGLSKDHDALLGMLAGFFNAKAGAKIPKEISVVTWMALVGVIVAWFYSVFEAPVSASKTTHLEGNRNLGDKSGWEP